MQVGSSHEQTAAAGRRAAALASHLGEAPPHPLDPLRDVEIKAAAKACRDYAAALQLELPQGLRFSSIAAKVRGQRPAARPRALPRLLLPGHKQ